MIEMIESFYILYHLYISLYIILYRTAPGQREIFRGSPSPGALGFFGANHRCHLFSIRKFSVGNSRGFPSFPPSFHHTLIGLCLRRILWMLLVERETEEVHLQNLESCVGCDWFAVWMFQFTSVAFQLFLSGFHRVSRSWHLATLQVPKCFVSLRFSLQKT